jgi:hypothetical protein
MGQLLQLRVEQRTFGQMCLNTFDFAETTPEPLTGASFALATAFGLIPVAAAYPAATPFRLWRDLIDNSVEYIRFTIRTLYSVTDFYEAGFLPSTFGLVATANEAMSPTLAYGITSNRVRTDVRRGSKRFAGVTETAVGDGGTVVPSALANWQLFCNSISVPITATVAGQAYSFSSSVLPKQTPGDNVGQVGEFWPTYSAQLAKSAIGLAWTPQQYIRTQVSRQYGRGA